jgi:hypothetical protein
MRQPRPANLTSDFGRTVKCGGLNAVGKIFRLVGTAQEITEQKKAEDQLAKLLIKRI